MNNKYEKINGVWSEETREAVKRLVLSGKFHKEISEELGISRAAIKGISAYLKIHSPKIRPFTEEEVKILRKLIVERKTFSQIAELMGRTISSVKNYYNSHKKDLEVKYNPEEKKKTLTKTEEQILEKYRMGRSAKQLSKEYGLTKSQVSNLARRYKVKQLSKLEQAELGYLNGEFVGVDRKTLEHLAREGKSVINISEMFDLPLEFIRHRMRILNIKFSGIIRQEETRKKVYSIFYGKELDKSNISIPAYKLITREKLIEFLEKYNYQVRYLSRELGIDSGVIINSIKYHKIKLPERKTIRDYSKEFFEELLIKKYSLPEIAEIIGYDKEYTREYLNELFENNLDFQSIIGKYKSNGEYITAKALILLNLTFKKEFYITVENNEISQERVVVDFMIIYNGKEYWIEYNGEQHYKKSSSFLLNKSNHIETFKNQVSRDNYIKRKAKEKGVVFIEIPYTFYSISKIQDLLQRVIIDGEDINDIIDYTPFYKEINELGISIDD